MSYLSSIPRMTGLLSVFKVSLAGVLSLTTGLAQAQSASPLMLTHDPLTLSAELAILEAEPNQTSYYLVAYHGPIQPDWKTQLSAAAEIMEAVPPFAFLVRTTQAQADTIATWPPVQAVTLFQPAYRISQRALDQLYTADLTTGQIPYTDLAISVFRDEDLDRITAQLRQLGSMPPTLTTTPWRSKLIVSLPTAKIGQAAAIAGIRWIEPVPQWQVFNNKSATLLNVAPVRDSHGLYGAGQTLGIADTGIDAGELTVENLLDDFEDGAGGSRITQIMDVANDGRSSDVRTGHGTHVAGSAVGNGLLSGCAPLLNQFPDGCFAGMAPKAHLVFQALENNDNGQFLPPTDLNTLFAQAQTAGANLHSNSWGTTSSGEYTLDAQEVDQYSWDHPDFLIVFAAGNSGVDRDADGLVDLWNMATPATAKNTLSIGSSEGNRPDEGLINTWGLGSPTQFPAQPIASDPLSDNPNGLAASSSRGPTWDGRYKPDLVTPGTNILSTRSSQISGSGWAPHANSNYMYLGGTSMATPLAAGSALLLREYLMTAQGFTAPSAALLKAALINSAENIAPGQYGTGVQQEIPTIPPTQAAGWGRLNLGQGVYPTAPFNILYYDQAGDQALNTNEMAEFALAVTDSSQPLKINLAWNDYPGSPPFGGLVNDLDLQVTAPDGTVHHPANSQPSATHLLSNDTDAASLDITDATRVAVQFTPSAYPAHLSAIRFLWVNLGSSTDNLEVVVYDDDGNNGLPGTELSRTTLNFASVGWITFGLDLTIHSGSYYLSLEATAATQFIAIEKDTNPTGRSLVHNGSEWLTSPHTYYIRSLVNTLEPATLSDHTNNVEGITLDQPTPGLYTIRVKGYNVPFGPQSYAVVASGNIAQCTLDIDQNAQADALTDGLLLLRYLFGFRGETLMANAIDPVHSTRNTAAAVESYLAQCQPVWDIDNNQQTDALTDGLLVIRYLFGFRGDTLLENAVDTLHGTRLTAEAVEHYLQALIPAP